MPQGPASWRSSVRPVAAQSAMWSISMRAVEVQPSTEHSPVAAAGRLNVMGTQFHPEKSGADGLRVYANFLAVCGEG